jgi:hypothetical protein
LPAGGVDIGEKVSRLSTGRAEGNGEKMARLTFMPHERWFVALVERRQRDHRTGSVVRIETKYGPHGVALMAAGLFTMVPGELIAALGLALLLFSGSASALGLTGLALLVLGIGVIVVGAVRLAQAIPAGRAFRKLS